MIYELRHNYKITELVKMAGIARSTCYYQIKQAKKFDNVADADFCAKDRAGSFCFAQNQYGREKRVKRGVGMNEAGLGRQTNLWRMMLTKPRMTLRWLLEHRPGYGVPLLTVLQGIAITFQQVTNEELMRLVNFPAFVMMAVVTGPLWGAVAVYGGSYIMKWTGRVFGGAANVAQLRMALAWASLPSVFQLLIVLGVLLRFGVTGEAIEPLAALQSGAISVAIGLWQLVLLIACLMEVQEYAFSKALGNVVLFTLVMFFVLLLPLILVGIVLVS